MKRAEIITALLEQARDKDTLANYDPNSIFTFDANVLTEAALMLFAVNDWVSVKDALPLTAGLVFARDEHRCGTLAFIIGAAMNSALSILLLLGLEALENFGGI